MPDLKISILIVEDEESVRTSRGHLTKRKFMFVKAGRSSFLAIGGVGTHLEPPFYLSAMCNRP
jgi:hypothetical protein